MKKLMLLALVVGLATSAWAWIPGEGTSDFEGQTSSDVAAALTSQNPLLVPAPLTWANRNAVTNGDPVSRTAFIKGSDNKFHLICGNCATHTSHPYDVIYDPATGTWTQGLNHPLGTTVGVHNHMAVAVGTKIYVGGGSSGAAFDDQFTVIDLVANTWTVVGTMPIVQNLYYWLSAAGNKIYMFGGASAGGTTIHNQTWEYDIVGNTWTQKANMPAAMRDVQAATVGDTIYVCGGCTTYPTGLNTCYAYNTVANTYTPKANMPGGVLWGSAFTMMHRDSGAQVVVVGGLNTNPLATTYRYDVRTNTWKTDGNLIVARRSHGGSASPLASGDSIFVAGGYGAAGILASCERGYADWGGSGVESPEPVTRQGGLSLAVSPNPARGGTSVAFSLPVSGEASLKVYDAQGRLVRTLVSGTREAGTYRASLGGLSAGVYFLNLQAGNFTATRKLVVAR
jgi:N-acetylneuraminic acid mutarotase